jgi:hypothetical protein
MSRLSGPIKQLFKRQPGERVRFYGAQKIPLAGNKCRVRVRLDLPSGGSFVATVEGPAGADAELRTAGEATLEALRQVVQARKLAVTFELTEVAAFEAFSKPGVMVSVKAVHQEQVRSLLGFSPVEENPARSVALAILSATNRFLAAA